MPAWTCSENPGETGPQRSQDGAVKTFWEKTEKPVNGIWDFFTRKGLASDNVEVRRSKA